MVEAIDVDFFPPKRRRDGDELDVMRRAKLIKPEVDVGVSRASGTRTDADRGDENENVFFLNTFPVRIAGGSDDTDVGNGVETDETGAISVEDAFKPLDVTTGDASLENPMAPTWSRCSPNDPHDAVSGSGDVSRDDATKRPTLAISSNPPKTFPFSERMLLCNNVERKTSRELSKPGGTET